ncbi:MAG: hypothetical protein V3V67_01255, partial [Myxococcota bacterium]
MRTNSWRWILLVAVAAAATGAADAPMRGVEKNVVVFEGEEFPALAPLGPVPIPRDNPQSVDENGFPLMDDPKVQLGKLLF